MKINGNMIRPGNVIEHNGRLWVAVKIQHTQPGKGGAYLQVELKDMQSGTKLNDRFRSSESVERVQLEQKPYAFLYKDGSDYTFMDQETYEQVTLNEEFIGDAVDFLVENMVVDVAMYEGKPLTIQLPENVVRTVIEADPVVKGQTASSSYKPAMLDNGRRILVPPHVESGMRIVVNTSDGSYVERARD